MKGKTFITLAAAMLFLAASHCESHGQGRLTLTSGHKMLEQPQYGVFAPIAKYLAAGDVESLSAWFSPTLEITILGTARDASKKQAIQILKVFFKNYTPHSFSITHQAGRENLKYMFGNLDAGVERFAVTIFVSRQDAGSFEIQQLKIDSFD